MHRHPIEYYSALRKEILIHAIASVYPEDSIRPISQSVIGEEIPDPAKMGYIRSYEVTEKENSMVYRHGGGGAGMGSAFSGCRVLQNEESFRNG